MLYKLVLERTLERVTLEEIISSSDAVSLTKVGDPSNGQRSYWSKYFDGCFSAPEFWRLPIDILPSTFYD